jgi:hypothetical protein
MKPVPGVGCESAKPLSSQPFWDGTAKGGNMKQLLKSDIEEGEEMQQIHE